MLTAAVISNESSVPASRRPKDQRHAATLIAWRQHEAFI
jgi:hypothetical protein